MSKALDAKHYDAVKTKLQEQVDRSKADLRRVGKLKRLFPFNKMIDLLVRELQYDIIRCEKDMRLVEYLMLSADQCEFTTGGAHFLF